jgi:hypothetical protein
MRYNAMTHQSREESPGCSMGPENGSSSQRGNGSGHPAALPSRTWFTLATSDMAMVFLSSVFVVDSLPSERAMDERFSRVLTDPRFRRFKKKDTKVRIDARFLQVLRPKKQRGRKGSDDNDFDEEDFAISASVDKYGRPAPSKK